jgi:Nucleotide-diphospho-sugar transferase
VSLIKSTICIAEDRAACEPSLKILLLSLSEHCPGTEINLFYPPGGRKFLSWIEKCPQVRLQTAHLTKGAGWNVKPRAIMHTLDQGFDEVIWIDSDVIVTRNIAPIFSGLESQIFMASDEGRDPHPDALRARLWGLPVGRVLPFAVNSGVIRATKDHYRLMERWWELLQSKEYQKAQQKGWAQSPIHMKGDQDVLTALLTSIEFSHIPIRLLRRGRDIVLFDGIFGYTVGERLRNLLRGSPPLIHITGLKPWSAKWRLERPISVKGYIEHVYFDVSPYTLSALRFRDELGCDTDWMEPHYVPSRILRAAGMGCPPLVGMPIAAFADLVRIARSTFGSWRAQLSFITE